MTKWEYRVSDLHSPRHGDLPERLNEMGADGWELVSHTAPDDEAWWTFLFKRPLVEER